MATATKMARKPARAARRSAPKAVRRTAAKAGISAATASALRDYFVQRIEAEHAITLRVMQNVQPGDWRPDPRSRDAVSIAWHIAHSENWFYASIAKGKFNPENAADPPVPAGMDQVITYFDGGFKKNIASLKRLKGAQLAKISDFFGMKHPLVEFMGFMLVHTVHHRAQLSTYLRPLGGKCPDIYGGSADEPWQA